MPLKKPIDFNRLYLKSYYRSYQQKALSKYVIYISLATRYKNEYKNIVNSTFVADRNMIQDQKAGSRHWIEPNGRAIRGVALGKDASI